MEKKNNNIEITIIIQFIMKNRLFLSYTTGFKIPYLKFLRTMNLFFVNDGRTILYWN
jgi:hypothetical protein